MGSHLDRFTAGLDFDLDDFQLRGCRAVEAGHGVLVCAPTGAGKTVVGEFAVDLALAQGTKCFYTTPIKALSNQKFNDLCATYGEDRVGLLTGDRSINGTADVVVMTTEVLRNMIYAHSPQLDRLSHVVMDEIHYLADASRGAVWEEVILNLDEDVHIIGLSATVSNSEEFGEWLATVRGDTEVVVTDHRPVPLDQWMLVGRAVLPLFEPGPVAAEGTGGGVSRALQRAIDRAERRSTDDAPHERRGGFRSRSTGRRPGRERPTRERSWRPPSRPDVIAALRDQGMLPAITFIFSRAGCDGALHQCLRSRLVLTDQDEADRIGEIVDAGVAGIPEEDLKVLGFRQWRAALTRGFAAHHAGMLPAFRLIIEDLFQRGLVRAVFATETLALGINMPARTVVLEKLVKYNGETHAELTPAEYTQLTGRAGRRGIDTVGNAVVQWAPAVDPHAVAGLASTRTYPLVSTFAPGFNMAVNLLGTLGYATSLDVLESSFAQFQADRAVVGDARKLDRARARVTELEEQLAAEVAALAPPSDDPLEDLLDYLELRRELSDEEKAAHRNAYAEREKETLTLLARLQRGEVIAMPAKRRPVLAVVVNPANQTLDPRPQVISETGWAGRIEVGAFANPPVVLGRMKLPKGVQHNPRRHAKYVRDQFHRHSFGRPKHMRTRPRVRPTAKVTALREAVHNHPVHDWPGSDRESLARTGEKLIRRRREARSLAAAVDGATDTLARAFTRILDLLAEYSYVEFDESGTPHVTDEGERLARIHNEADLLVAQCLRRGIWDGLDPAELAGTVSTCVFENRRETSGEAAAPTDDMADAMNATERIYAELASDERRHRLPVTREPEPGFALAMHQWTAGAPLGYAIQAAAECGAELTPGDFVRWARRVVDLLEQVAATGYSDEVRRNARRAVDAIRRGVVALGN